MGGVRVHHASSGLRWGELAGLRRCDVDPERKLVTVARKLRKVNGELSFSPPKTAASKRTVGIPSFVARALAVHVDLYALPNARYSFFRAPTVSRCSWARDNHLAKLGGEWRIISGNVYPQSGGGTPVATR